MRFDLEIHKVSELDHEGLKYISEVLYNNSDDTILPALYDRKTLFYSSLSNRGKINTDSFNNFKEVPTYLFQSYIDKDISIFDTVPHASIIYPFFNGGTFYSCNKKFVWSDLYIKQPISYNEIDGYYKFEMTDDVIENSISIYTLAFLHPGYIDKSKEFVFREFNTSLKNTFSNTKEDYLYTIYNNAIYLNVKKIEYSDYIIGQSTETSRAFPLPEFPVVDVSVNGFSQSEYTIISGLLTFNQNSSLIAGETIKISCVATPVISYKRSTDVRSNIVSLNDSITPNSLGFENGILCIYNSYNNVNIPSNITLEVETVNEYNNIFKLTSRLENSLGIPIKNKSIEFNILDEGALFSATNSSKFTGTTAMNGEVSCTLFSDFSNTGIYIQKEWVNGTVLTIPKDLNIDNIDNAFLYIVTNDDPILGKAYSYGYETPITESYKDLDISSYYVSGRKIAYIELVNNNGKLEQKYCKPISTTRVEDKSILFRNLFVENKEYTILSNITDATYDSDLAIDPSMYKSGSIPFNRIQLYSREIPVCTELDFGKSIPKTSTVSGYYLVLNKTIRVQATHKDAEFSISSDIKDILIRNIKSESPFIISGIAIKDRNTALNDLGYYTVSDYIQNEYNLYPCTYGCIYSDVIDKKCNNKNKSYQTYYQPDSNNTMCIHTPEYDATLEEQDRCPGLDARITNPFVLPVEGE